MLFCPAWRPTREQPDPCELFLVPGITYHVNIHGGAAQAPDAHAVDILNNARCTGHPDRMLEQVRTYTDHARRIAHLYQAAGWTQTCWDCTDLRPANQLDCPRCEASAVEPNDDEDQDEDQDEDDGVTLTFDPEAFPPFTDNRNRYWEWDYPTGQYQQRRPPVTTTEGAWD